MFKCFLIRYNKQQELSSKEADEMADSIIEPDTDHLDTSVNEFSSTAEKRQDDQSKEQQEAAKQQGHSPVISHANKPQQLIIWTPRFIVLFMLVLVIGLSALSVLTQVWLNGAINSFWVSSVQVVVILAGWIALLVVTSSQWVRLGGIFGCIWSAFTAFNLISGFFNVWHYSLNVTLLHAISSSALLGTYICLSLDATPFRRWDNWFFRLAVPVGIIITLVPFFDAAAAYHTINWLASDTTRSVVILSLLVWWLRPSCWKSQPGPTFLYGFAPLILLFLTFPNAVDAGGSFFYSNLVYLCLILGLMRTLQAEIHRQ
jgi:hypothetical protein